MVFGVFLSQVRLVLEQALGVGSAGLELLEALRDVRGECRWHVLYERVLVAITEVCFLLLARRLPTLGGLFREVVQRLADTFVHAPASMATKVR